MGILLAPAPAQENPLVVTAQLGCAEIPFKVPSRDGGGRALVCVSKWALDNATVQN